LLGAFKGCHQGVFQLAEENLVGAVDRDKTGDNAIRLKGITKVV
jgi:hypothetical protein